MLAKVSAYEFGNFTLDLIRKKLIQKDSQQEIAVGERNFMLLRILCSASPDPVHKNDLTEKLWPNTQVSDASLSRLISDTRQLLNDDGENQELIKTARGLGFLMPNVIQLNSFIDSSIAKKTRYKNITISLIVSSIIVLSVFLFSHFQSKVAHNKLVSALTAISEFQDNSYTAFIAQAKRRNELVDMLETRLNISREQQFEKFFAFYHSQFNQQEAFVCAQMRAITDLGLMENNRNIVNTLNAHPAIFEHFSDAKALQQHLTFWLNKYESVFKIRDDMCLLYVGVEDNLPYPSGIDQRIKKWLESN